jgi:hypothetical protein
MHLTNEQSYALFEKRGCYVKEICDRCGTAIHYANRFTIRGEPGVWCSRECRDGVKVREPGTCRHCKAMLPVDKRRGAVFCDDACRKASRRESGESQTVRSPELSRTNTSIYAGFCAAFKPPGGDIAKA